MPEIPNKGIPNQCIGTNGIPQVFGILTDKRILIFRNCKIYSCVNSYSAHQSQLQRCQSTLVMKELTTFNE